MFFVGFLRTTNDRSHPPTWRAGQSVGQGIPAPERSVRSRPYSTNCHVWEYESPACPPSVSLPDACRLRLDRQQGSRRREHYLQTTDEHYEAAIGSAQNATQSASHNGDSDCRPSPVRAGKSGKPTWQSWTTNAHAFSGRHWIRTSDLCGVNTAL